MTLLHPAPPAKRTEPPAEAPVPPGRDWIRLAVLLAAVLALAAAWKWTPLRRFLDPDLLASWVRPYRMSWAAFPLTVAAYVLLELVFFPVLLLILITGMAFGPWPGCAYALAGCLASGSVAFALGRRLGHRTIERLAGERARRIGQAIGRNGILAVYLIRKIPAPFTLANLVIGASRVSYRDFLIGTTLGMGTLVAVVTVFGFQLGELLRNPTPRSVAIAALILLIPLTISLVLNQALKRRKGGEPC